MIKLRVGLAVIASATLALGSGCGLRCVLHAMATGGESCPAPDRDGRALVVAPDSISVEVGGAVTLTAQLPGSQAPAAVNWTSSDTSVATVEAGFVGTAAVGFVHAKNVGTATISALASGYVGRARIKVIPKQASPR